MATDDANWNLLFDAAIFGYRVRQAEDQLSPQVNEFSPDYTEALRARYESTNEVVIGVGATEVQKNLPEPFSMGVDLWNEVSAWAALEAINRSD